MTLGLSGAPSINALCLLQPIVGLLSRPRRHAEGSVAKERLIKPDIFVPWCQLDPPT